MYSFTSTRKTPGRDFIAHFLFTGPDGATRIQSFQVRNAEPEDLERFAFRLNRDTVGQWRLLSIDDPAATVP